MAIKIQSRYILDPCKIHAGYMRDTCGKRVSGVWGNVWMPSWRAAHLSGHPCHACAEVGLLQHPPAKAPAKGRKEAPEAASPRASKAKRQRK